MNACQRRTPAPRPRQGFTLIELLVVIAIIAILAAILFPVFAKARIRAQVATCQSNLKQFGQAALMYENDNNDTILPGTIAKNAGDLYNLDLAWYGLINPYIKVLNKQAAGSTTDDKLFCPLSPRITSDLRRSYGYNIWYLGVGYPVADNNNKPLIVNSGQVKYPTQTVRLCEGWSFDTRNNGKGAGSVYYWPPVHDASIGNPYSGGYYSPPGWHSGINSAKYQDRLAGQNTVLWMDGHVSSLAGSKILKPYANSNNVSDALFQLNPTGGKP